MPDIASIGQGPIASLNRLDASTPAVASAAAPTTNEAERRPGDRVDLSQRARLLGRLRDLPDVRTALVGRVRDEIDGGAYPSDGQIDIAIDRLLEDLAN